MRASHFVAVVRPDRVAEAMPSCVTAARAAGSWAADADKWIRTRIEVE